MKKTLSIGALALGMFAATACGPGGVDTSYGYGEILVSQSRYPGTYANPPKVVFTFGQYANNQTVTVEVWPYYTGDAADRPSAKLHKATVSGGESGQSTYYPPVFADIDRFEIRNCKSKSPDDCKAVASWNP